MRRIIVSMLVILAFSITNALADGLHPQIFWSRFMHDRLMNKYNLSDETATNLMEDLLQTVEIDGQEYTWRFCQVQYNPEKEEGTY